MANGEYGTLRMVLLPANILEARLKSGTDGAVKLEVPDEAQRTDVLAISGADVLRVVDANIVAADGVVRVIITIFEKYLNQLLAADDMLDELTNFVFHFSDMKVFLPMPFQEEFVDLSTMLEPHKVQDVDLLSELARKYTKNEKKKLHKALNQAPQA